MLRWDHRDATSLEGQAQPHRVLHRAGVQSASPQVRSSKGSSPFTWGWVPLLTLLLTLLPSLAHANTVTANTVTANTTPVTASAGGPTPPPATAAVQQIVSCAEARTAHTLATVKGYSVRISSQRQGYSLEGKLEEDYRIVKTVTITPTSRNEKFEKGEKNGKTADVDDFWMEKLGMSKKYNPEAMNLFSKENKGRYDYVLKGQETLKGRAAWKLAFKVKTEGSQELQRGHVWIDQASCGVVRAEGSFPKVWVTERVQADLALTEVQPGLWLPSKQVVDLEVSMPLLKRRAKMIDEYSAYQVRGGR